MKRAQAKSARLPSTLDLTKQTLKTLKKHWHQFALVTAIFAITFTVFVGVGGQADAAVLKDLVGETYSNNAQIVNDSIVAGVVLGSGLFQAGEAASSYGFILVVMASLAYIWLLRQVWAKRAPVVKDSLYKGMYPIIPVIMLVFLLSFQLLPLALGNFILVTVIANGLAISQIELLLVVVVFLGLALLSGWFAVRTLIAMYIATLPDMTPLSAYKEARHLVKNRRWAILRRIVSFMFGALFILVLLLLLTVGAVPALAYVILALLTFMLLPVFHTFVYTMYRNL